MALHHVEFRVLGPFEVHVEGTPVEVGSRKQRMLLSVLVVEANRLVAADTLARLLWDDAPPPSADVTLRSLVSRLRRALGDAGSCVEGRDGGYRLRIDPDRIDAVRFERDLVRGRDQLAAGRAGEAVETLNAALALWRGPALREIADHDIGRPVAHRLEEAQAAAVEELAEADLATGRPEDALTRLQAHVAVHPLRERPWGQLMLALYRSGRQADALAAYRRIRTLLRDELGVDPNPVLAQLEQRILAQDPRLNAECRVVSTPVEEAVSELPTPLTSLVGRVTELAELAENLTGARLLTLTGVGGVGKTRLALQLAVGVADRFTGGVRLAELGPLTPDNGAARWAVVAEMASVLDVATPGATTPADVVRRIAGRLRGRPMLLVLDNCEHVVDAVAPVVDSLLRQCAGLTVLATSREPLGVTGEVVWGVPPLSLPPAGRCDLADLRASDAVALFSQRARAAHAGFELTAENASAVEHICRHLDGVPLALELAAVRMRALGAQQVAARLDDRFGLLTAGERTALPRQQTLRATMDWSYRLLWADEQIVLRRLTVFAATFDLEAAEEVAGPDGPAGRVADLVFRLVDKSVVVVQRRRGEVRFGLLETVRTYGAERLSEAGETDVVRRRHRAYYVTVAAAQRRVSGPGWDSSTWHRRVAAEEDNFRTAVAASLADGDHDAALLLLSGLWVHWAWTTGRSEAIGWLEQALDGPGRDPVARAECTIALAVLLRWWELGEPDRSVRLFARAKELAEVADDDGCRFWARYFHAEFLLLRGDGDAATALYLDALRWAPRRSAGWCSYSFGWIEMGRGDATAARAEFECAVDLAGPDDLVLPHALAALAPLLAGSGEHGRAESTAAAAVASARAFPLPGVHAMALVRAAQSRVLCGADAAARATVVELFELLYRLGNLQFRAEAFEVVAVLAGRGGDLHGAARYLGSAGAVRAARSEDEAGVRVLGAAVDVTRDKAIAALGAAGYEREAAAGAAVPPLDLVTEMRTGSRRS